MFDISIIIQFILLGAFVGFISGLFGIGGGGIIVPILTGILLSLQFDANTVVHASIGTSMGIMAITSFSSMLAQHKKQAVLWDMFKLLVPSIIVGTFLASFLASYLSSFTLAIIFAIFMFLTSINMFFGSTPKNIEKEFSKKIHYISGAIFGALSALISVAGGMFIVPYLLAQGIDIKKAIGTSSAIGFILTLSGALGYMINGYMINHTSLDYTIGFLFLPAIFFVALASVFTAPIGVKLAHKMSSKLLKKIFSLIPFFLSIKLIYELV